MRQRTAVQVNQFVGGLNTEANPLTYPENFSFDEQNLEIRLDGSRKRRKGFDIWPYGTFQRNSGVTLLPGVEMGRSLFMWRDPSGFTGIKVAVVQIGHKVFLHRFDQKTNIALTDNTFSLTFATNLYSNTFSYAVVNGNLIIANGSKNFLTVVWDGTTFLLANRSLLVRDFWGTEASGGAGVTLTDPLNKQIRPAVGSFTGEHRYNLRNQTFAIPRVEGDADTLNVVDPIQEFHIASGNTVYPSNSDSVTRHLFADANLATNRTIERFNATSMWKTPPSSGEAPKGYFIIDAMERGVSRLAQELALKALHPTLIYPIGSLPIDTTPGGPGVVASYAGRAWFAGFSSIITSGDDLSPAMGNYVLFSQLSNSPSQTNLCYQVADPTSNEDPDIVDTDGGFIKVDGAIDIKALVPLRTSLFVFASNGVWRISGPDNNLFTATTYSVSKVSVNGCINPQSVVLNEEGNIFYWGKSGIFALGVEESSGEWTSTNISEGTIQTLYNGIVNPTKTTASKAVNVVGAYDAISKSVRWCYGVKGTIPVTATEELVFNTSFRAFTRNKVNPSNNTPGMIGLLQDDEPIELNGIVVKPLESHYLVWSHSTGGVTYGFGGYHGIKDGTPVDFFKTSDYTNSLTGTPPTGGSLGVDSPAYLLTGPVYVGDNRLRKEVPYLTTIFERTNKSGGVSSDDSSCFVQAHWDWTTNPITKKWSTSREAYRPQALEPGQDKVVTRNKIRGSGKTVSFLFESSNNKQMHLYGWEFNLQAGSEE